MASNKWSINGQGLFEPLNSAQEPLIVAAHLVDAVNSNTGLEDGLNDMRCKRHKNCPANAVCATCRQNICFKVSSCQLSGESREHIICPPSTLYFSFNVHARYHVHLAPQSLPSLTPHSPPTSSATFPNMSGRRYAAATVA